MHDDRGISNCEIAWLLWSSLIVGAGVLIMVLAVVG